jgi:serine protease Do
MRHPIRVVTAAFAAIASVGLRAAAQPASGPETGVASLAQFSGAIEALTARVMPAVVQVFATSFAPPEDAAATTDDPLATEHTSGTGVVVDPDGYIVTNAHIVEHAVKVRVELGPGPAPAGDARAIRRARGRLVPAEIVAVDEETDLAVLKVAAGNLPALTFGDSDRLHPGQIVLAFGSPLGFERSVTMGVVSAVARQVEPRDPMVYVQTDATINPGNSGGPLVDADGRIVGINTFIFSEDGANEGIGFAAPSNVVRRVFEEIRKTGRARHGEIGVSVESVTPVVAEGLQLPQDWGVLLADVFPDGPAAKAGLEAGDLVLALDTRPMDDPRQFQASLLARAVGDVVTLEVLRGAARRTVKVMMAERGDDPARFTGLANPREHAVVPLGILALPLTPDLVDDLPPLRRDAGLLVTGLIQGGARFRDAEFRPGDVIYLINGQSVRAVGDMREALARLKRGSAVVVQIEREGVLANLAFRLP